MRRVVAEEAIGAHDEDDQPPIIPRYDPAHSDAQIPSRTQVVRQIYTAGPQQIVRTIPATAKNVIYLKSTDGGTQKMMVRAATGKPSSDQQIYRQNSDFQPGTVLPGGTRVVAVRPGNIQNVRQVYNPGNGGASGGSTRFVRVQNATIANSRPVEQPPIVRRVVQQRPMDTYQDQDQNVSSGQQQQPRYIIQGANTQQSQKMPRTMVPRGGLTMQMVQQQQQQQHTDHRRLMAGRQRQKVTTYRDFMASRGYLDSPKFMMQPKPTFLPFEFNEEEEREINEAIAREEEWMRLEEENKIGGYDSRSYGTSPNDANRAPPYVSNLLPSSNDTPDDKVIKQVLDVMFSQVCRWDRQYGWSKTHMKRARQKNETEKTQLRKVRLSQREVLISEHMDRLKKEINKRRTKIENEAEQQCGLLTPWRKSRSRPHRIYDVEFEARIGLKRSKKDSDSDSKETFVSSESEETVETETDQNLENEIAEILPQFESAESDWKIENCLKCSRRTNMAQTGFILDLVESFNLKHNNSRTDQNNPFLFPQLGTAWHGPETVNINSHCSNDHRSLCCVFMCHCSIVAERFVVDKLMTFFRASLRPICHIT
ncbi:hypothetical protein GCK72_004669 [Caenorhabditis remanei]|uniref:Uncharacterized protein n=1 Tax=Caenorhabditis remanei TaxID=31234 RepID=A0A6A5HCJ0_CAERE|nr:hypothetical protein GCK72_004669 [Caenorhabditis remanei]KAF1764719.1 hypothetical protein GCK72_004669 [Caenorhabditis remanei]